MPSHNGGKDLGSLPTFAGKRTSAWELFSNLRPLKPALLVVVAWKEYTNISEWSNALNFEGNINLYNILLTYCDMTNPWMSLPSLEIQLLEKTTPLKVEFLCSRCGCHLGQQAIWSGVSKLHRWKRCFPVGEGERSISSNAWTGWMHKCVSKKRSWHLMSFQRIK